MAAESWDVLVVGGGAAGMTAARAAAVEGARVVLVEREPALGGECTFYGCVPSKAIIEVAKRYWGVRRGERLGIRADGLRMDFATLMAHKDAVIADINRDERPELFEEAGIALRRGELRFTGPNEAAIDGDLHRFERAVVATGSDPRHPPRHWARGRSPPHQRDGLRSPSCPSAESCSAAARSAASSLRPSGAWAAM